MQIKTIGAAATLAFASSAAVAGSYQSEAGGYFEHTDFDDISANGREFGLAGEYHFSPVNIGDHPLAEAAFLNHSSHIYAGVNRFTQSSADLDTANLGIEFYVPDAMLYVAGEVIYQTNGDSDTDFLVAVGLTLLEGLLARATYQDEADQWGLDAKYVFSVGQSSAINLEGGYLNDDNFDAFRLSGDFYIDSHLSIGAGVVHFDNDNASNNQVFEVRGRSFFTDEFSVELAFAYDDDAFRRATLSAAYRF